MNLFCIILARGGSKGLPGKNIKEFCGKPLIAHSIEAALASASITSVYVSSDDDHILDVAKEYGATTLKRPAEYSSDTATSDDAIFYHFSELQSQGQKFDGILLLQPTSPLRTTSDIDEAIKLFQESGTSIFSVTELEVSPFRSYKITDGILQPLYEGEKYTRRQDEPATYAANGAIYLFKAQAFLENKKIPRDRITPYVMSRDKSIDIDDIYDFKLAEFIKNEIK